MRQTCPHCGADLPEDAAFCPHCAKDVHPRKGTGNPILLRKKALLCLLALAVVMAAGAGLWYRSRPYVPQEFDGLCGEPQVVWTVRMKNGDVIRVWQNIHVTLIHTYTYDWHDYPMDTLEELQALLDRVAA